MVRGELATSLELFAWASAYFTNAASLCAGCIPAARARAYAARTAALCQRTNLRHYEVATKPMRDSTNIAASAGAAACQDTMVAVGQGYIRGSYCSPVDHPISSR